MKREILIPIAILTLALLAAAGAPAVGVFASNAAFGAEKTAMSASLGAEGGSPAFGATVTQATLRRRGRGLHRHHRRWQRWPDHEIKRPIAFACVVQKDFDEGGSAPYPIIRIVNTGQITIPAGTTFKYQLSTGQWGSYTLHHALAPGQNSTAIDVQHDGWVEGVTCTAQAIHVQHWTPQPHIRRYY